MKYKHLSIQNQNLINPQVDENKNLIPKFPFCLSNNLNIQLFKLIVSYIYILYMYLRKRLSLNSLFDLKIGNNM